ncbi:MAG: gonadoliberin III [Alteromonadaceae bacterium]|nr:gonadoliberin III [Alteromonadaceae bacterium]
MNKQLPFYLAVALLVIAGLAIATLRHNELNVPLTPGVEQTVWQVEAKIEFQAYGDPVTASLALPDQPPGFRVMSEQSASPGYGFSTIQKGGIRRGEWSIRRANGRQTLYYKVQLITDPSATPAPPEQPPVATGNSYWSEPEATAAEGLINQARETSSSPESLARELIKLLNNSESNQNAALLLAQQSTAEVLVRLLNQAGLPARISMGLQLEDARRNQGLLAVADVYTKDGWITFDPRTGDQDTPENLLLWQRGGSSLLDVLGGRRSTVSFSMLQQTVPAQDLVQSQSYESGFSRFSLYHLPLEEQGMFKILLLLPVGALVVVFMRIIVGFRTSGTFMPILIAVAFLQTSLVPGLISFLSIVAVGLLLRGYLSRLNLLLVARIATLIILVIFITSFMALLGYELGISSGMTVTFFPMVIIAWTIERMSILWEEEGAQEVLIQGFGSLFVAVLAFSAMQWRYISHLSFNFPELHLIILAMVLLMGQYKGYRLSELRRFRFLAKD